MTNPPAPAQTKKRPYFPYTIYNYWFSFICCLTVTLVATKSAFAAPCDPAAMLKGEDEVIAPLKQILETNGIRQSPVLGCPAVRANVKSSESGLLVKVEDPSGRHSERVVADDSAAASFIESWARGDISLSLLEVPYDEETPPKNQNKSKEPPSVENKPSSRPLFIGLLAEVSGSTDSSIWFGGRVETCSMVGFVCLGGIVRLGYDPAVVGNSKDLETTRLGLDVLMAAQFPIAIKSVSLIPGLGLGAGWLRLSGSKWIGEEADSEDESSRPMKEESHVVDLGGLRADAFVNLSIDLTRSLSLVIGFTASFCGLADTENISSSTITHVDAEERPDYPDDRPDEDENSLVTTIDMAGEPWIYFRGTLGMRYRF
jgi:hypothetical protein